MKPYVIVLSIVFTFVFILPTEAQAVMYGFKCFTNTYGEGYIGEQQLTVDVTDPGGGQVLFTFKNSGPDPASIHEVYFEDGSLLQIYDDPTTIGVIDGIIDDSPDVVFIKGATPHNIPGANLLDPDFDATQEFGVDGAQGGSTDGVDPGEELGVLFDLKGGKTFADVITAISLGFTNPDITEPRNSLRIAMHVGGIGDRLESEGYIMTPIPPSVIIGLLGMSIAGIKLRKFA